MSEAASDRIQALWDKLSELGAHRIDEAVECLLTELSDLLGAHQAYWLGAVRLTDRNGRDPLQGWRAGAIQYRYQTPEDELCYQKNCELVESGQVDPSIAANLQGAGRFRINIMHELAPPGWYESAYYKNVFSLSGSRDVIFSATPMGQDVESWLAFIRYGGPEAQYGEAERALLNHAVSPMRWFHRQLVLHRGLFVADAPLLPSERRVLNELLTDKTKPQIARELGLSPATVHTYTIRICRKFNVRGRAGLTALWLGKLPERRR